jgi:hypothetical protein
LRPDPEYGIFPASDPDTANFFSRNVRKKVIFCKESREERLRSDPVHSQKQDQGQICWQKQDTDQQPANK